ncbi:acyl-CoA thioesterase [Zooshikella harenae]|uniref:Acyl-CoA thioesterase n=1 Tax=Zooshikella harenae TaxID=2827238 RepID=A0ABS5ZB56_9GAMM|nr:thioesterase family protein [Zooshikella harenae]MBU2711260.1 acyl-CoA thioesterase [Zooshikella harenae]
MVHEGYTSTQSKKLSVETYINVPFFDVDSMGLTWHGHYLKYFELGRCDLLKKIDYTYQQMEASNYIWPIVDLRVKYIKSARFDQSLKVITELVEYEHRLKLAYKIIGENGESLTKATTIQMAVNMTTGETLFSSPEILIEKMRAYYATQ